MLHPAMSGIRNDSMRFFVGNALAVAVQMSQMEKAAYEIYYFYWGLHDFILFNGSG